MQWSEFQNEVLDLYKPPMRAKATRKQLAQVFRELEEVGARRITDFDEKLVGRWIEAHELRSGVTAASLLRAMQVIGNYAAHKHYIISNPFEWRSGREWVRTDHNPPNHRDRHLTAEQVRAMLDQADEEATDADWKTSRLKALVYTYAFTGLRAGEALNLRVEDLDFRRGVITITPRKDWRPKTPKSAAKVAIHDELGEVLATWCFRMETITQSEWLFPGSKLRGPWTGGKGQDKAPEQIKALGNRAGIIGVTALSFRKTIGTLAKSWGFGRLELQSLLRHTDAQTQEFYNEEDTEVMRGITARISFPKLRRVGS